MIVDDDPHIRFEISEFIKFEFEDIILDEAETNAGVIELFARDKYRIVISDVMLPDISGLDLICQLHEKDPLIEMIVITGKSNDLKAEEKDLISKIPPDRFSFLRKPFDNDELFFLISKSLEKTKLEMENRALLENNLKHAEVGEMINGIAHDLKGFLSAVQLIAGDKIKFILQNMDVLQEKPRMLQGCDDIVEITDTAFEFIESILAIERINSCEGAVDVMELIKKSIMPLQYEMIQKGVKLNLSEQITPLMVYGNNQVIRVIMNLLKNAIEELKDKKNAFIDLSVKELEKQVLITIKDNGPGMKKNILEKLRKGVQFSSKGCFGNGLGITGAHKILKKIDGNLFINSSPGKGAEFIISLKACSSK